MNRTTICEIWVYFPIQIVNLSIWSAYLSLYKNNNGRGRRLGCEGSGKRFDLMKIPTPAAGIDQVILSCS